MQLGVSPWTVDVVSFFAPLFGLPLADEGSPAGAAELDDGCGESDDADAPLELQPVRARAIIPPPQARTPVVRRRLSCISKVSSELLIWKIA
jgi:hypothetical protein